MGLRILAAVAGLLGGLCWAARWAADLASGESAWSEQAHLAGLVLLGLALAGVGAGLVSRSAPWLRVLVAIAFPALVWSVYSVVKGDGTSVVLDGVIGACASVMSAVTLVVSRRRTRTARGRAGSHSR